VALLDDPDLAQLGCRLHFCGMITVISGTNRWGSKSLKLAQLLVSMYEEQGSATRLLDLSELPQDIFTPLIYQEKPAAFIRDFVEPVLSSRGLHVVVPEYNGSFPGILKYFIDLLPFPDAFEGRPTAYVGVAAGMFGALRAVEQLQMVFGYRNAQIYPRRVFLPAAHNSFDAEGLFADAALEQRLREQVTGFQDFVRRLKD